jgi:hypothetical protein
MNRECREKRPLLKEHAEATAKPTTTFRIGIEHRLAKEFDGPLARRQQADNLAQQGRLATARAADQTKHLPGFDVEVDVPVDHDIVKLRTQAADLDHRRRSRADLRQGTHLGEPQIAREHREDGINQNHHRDRGYHRSGRP